MTADAHAATEAGIAASLARGDLREAATLLVRDYGAQILGYLCSVLRDDAAADEAYGRFCEELWKGLGGFRGESSARTWAYRVAWSCALRVVEDPHARRGRRLLTAEVSALAAGARSTLRPYERPAAHDWLRRMRETLSLEEQTLLILRVDRAMPWRDVALVLGSGVEPAALRKRFDRLKRRLHAAARAEGLVE